MVLSIFLSRLLVEFQFQDGSIKCVDISRTYGNVPKFQFQDGSIKCVSRSAFSFSSLMFQFQDGSIKCKMNNEIWQRIV